MPVVDVSMNPPLNPKDETLALRRALHFLKFRARSRKEIMLYLREKGFSTETTALVIDRLEASGLSGDAEFARMWVESRLRNRPRGKRALAAELWQKGISEDLIETALADIDEEAAAEAAVRPKLRHWRDLGDNDASRKIIDFLRRRGFPYALCRKTAEQMMQKNRAA
jgi:regulatory protein